jgi:hypothetical protein
MWIDCFVRFHREQAGKWVHPREMNPGHVEQFLTHLAVERHVAASTPPSEWKADGEVK